MEHLTKQQIVLLTLLVSFVTSLATGIITVSLVDQAPLGVTQTINRVVEKTIERVVSDGSSSSASVTNSVDPVATAVSKVSKSLVHLKPSGGLGIILSDNGLVLTDKANLVKDAVAVLPNGKELVIQVVQSEISGDNAFAVILMSKNEKLSPAATPATSTSIELGDRVFAFSGNGTALEEGFIKKVPEKNENRIETSISSKDVMLGSPLFNISGEVVGYKTKSTLEDSSFYSLNSIKSIAPVLPR